MLHWTAFLALLALKSFSVYKTKENNEKTYVRFETFPLAADDYRISISCKSLIEDEDIDFEPIVYAGESELTHTCFVYCVCVLVGVMFCVCVVDLRMCLCACVVGLCVFVCV